MGDKMDREFRWVTTEVEQKMAEEQIRQPGLTEISQALDKAIKDMTSDKRKLDDKQREVQELSQVYSKSVDNVQMLRGQLEKLMNEIIPSAGSSRVRQSA